MIFLKHIIGRGKRLLLDFRENQVYQADNTARRFNKAHGCPKLTVAEKKEIDNYWSAYNVKFQDYEWHRMYYAVTGLHDPRFIPAPFAERVLYRYYNKQEFVPAYADKNMFQLFLPCMSFPTSIGKRVNSRYYDMIGNYYGEELTQQYVDAVYSAFIEKCQGKTNEIVIKEAIGSKQGRGVRKCAVLSKESLNTLLTRSESKNFVLQIAVQQHPFFAQFNEDSVNIIRITTWRKKNEVYVLSPCIRFGIKGSHTDVAYVNGTEIINAVKIDQDGAIQRKYVTLNGEWIDLPTWIDTTVPEWENILKRVRTNALELPYFDFVAWDITVDSDNQVVCIEYNLKWPGTIVYQYAHGPMAGEHTDELLSFLQDESNMRLIPSRIRKK